MQDAWRAGKSHWSAVFPSSCSTVAFSDLAAYFEDYNEPFVAMVAFLSLCPEEHRAEAAVAASGARWPLAERRRYNMTCR